jgi:DNA-binding transcriptional regulator YiaG
MPKPGEFTVETKLERAVRLTRIRLQMRLSRAEFSTLCGWSSDFAERMETAALRAPQVVAESAKGRTGAGNGKTSGDEKPPTADTAESAGTTKDNAKTDRDPGREDPFKGQRLSHNLLMRALLAARFPLEALDLIPQGYSAHPVLATKLERYRERLDQWIIEPAHDAEAEAPVRGARKPYSPTGPRKPAPYADCTTTEQVRTMRALRIKHVRYQTGLSREDFGRVCDWFDGYWNVLRPGLKKAGHAIERHDEENINAAWLRIIEEEDVNGPVGGKVPLTNAQEAAALFFARYPNETLDLMGTYGKDPELTTKVEQYEAALHEWEREQAALS